MIVMKFGGTSVGTAERMKNILELIRGQKEILLVLSAMGGTTDALAGISEALHNQEKNKAAELIDALEER